MLYLLYCLPLLLVMLCVVRCLRSHEQGTTTTVCYEGTDVPVPSTPLTPHEQRVWEERVAPYRDGVPHPNSPAHHYHTSPKHAYTDINMDDPDWARTLEDELS